MSEEVTIYLRSIAESLSDIAESLAITKGLLEKLVEDRVHPRQRLNPAPAPSQTKTCPRCGSPMIVRNRRSDGAPFWGCSAYPDCRAIVDYEPEAAVPESVEDSSGLEDEIPF